MFNTLVETIAKAFQAFIEFLAVLVLGVIAGVLIVLPWLLRALAFFSWLLGMFLMWFTVETVYGGITDVTPLIALSAVPVIISIALIVWLFSMKRQGALWGAMTLWGFIGLLIWQKTSTVINSWKYSGMIVSIFPAALSAVLLLYMVMRWGPIVRAGRLSNQSKGGDAG